MTQRKSLSKKIRFEVFKRDSFTCQYCGSKAPDVILEVDHITPVKEGGSNDIMNLVTSCFNCNRGKSAKILSDKSTVEKQREQIKELNIRRQQLQMMLEWRDGLKSLECDTAKKAIDYWNDIINEYGLMLNDVGDIGITKLVKKHGIVKVLDAMDISNSKYIKDKDSCSTAFNKIGAILYLSDAPEHKQKISYIKGICRNKFSYFNERKASIALSKFYEDGHDLDTLKEDLLNGSFRNWTQFISYVEGK